MIFSAIDATTVSITTLVRIAAAFFVSVNVVKQRLRLASVSPRLLDVYAEDGLSLDQLMAFTVSGDHERQEQVYERLYQSYDKQPHTIRRMLTEGSVRAADKRAQFIGIESYVAAGGAVMRDLFQGDDGGWLQDVALVERMVAEKLGREAETVRAEGWKWIEVAPDFPYGHTSGLRQLRGEPVPMTDEETVARDALQAEYDRLSQEYDSIEDLPEAIDERFGELETALAAFEERPVAYDPAEVARAGAFVSIDQNGRLRVERGYVRPEDELPVEPEVDPARSDEAQPAMAADARDGDVVTAEPDAPEPEEEDGLTPISDRLMPAAAALSSAHLAALLFGPDLRRLYIASDADPAGDTARDILVERAAEAGIEAIALSPTLGDFNDDLRRLGLDALRAVVRVQIAPEDAARFMGPADP